MSMAHQGANAETPATGDARERGQGPVRTCVGCRSTDRQAVLLRVARTASADNRGRIIADPRRRAPGRGAYVHRDLGCLERAAKGLARSLRLGVSPRDLAALRATIDAGDATPAPGHGDRDVVEDPPPHKA